MAVELKPLIFYLGSYGCGAETIHFYLGSYGSRAETTHFYLGSYGSGAETGGRARFQ